MIAADLSHVSVRYEINSMTVELPLYLCHCFILVLELRKIQLIKHLSRHKQSVQLYKVMIQNVTESYLSNNQVNCIVLYVYVLAY